MTDSDLAGLLTQVFGDKVTHDVVLAAEGTALLSDLWTTVADLGLTGIGIDEESGGSGGTLADAVAVMEAAGAHAVPLPLLENHLARWAVGRGDGAGPWSIAGQPATLELSGTRVSGTVPDVAWGGSAVRVVAYVAGADRAVILDPSDATVSPGRDLAGQPRDSLSFDGADAEIVDGAVALEQVHQRGAVLRAAQMAGAMQAVYDVTDTYVYQREQFGRPVGTFQAVRSHLVQLAQMAVMTRLCVHRAAAALAAGQEASFAAYATKLLADQNAAVSIRSGHQAHGAIGMTREYVLQDLTRRLNAWRGDWGTERALSERIGAAVVDARQIARLATDEGALAV